MKHVKRTTPSTWRQMFKGQAGYLGVVLVGASIFDSLRVIQSDTPLNFTIPLLLVFSGGVLWWRAQRMAHDAIYARENGKVLEATVDRVSYVVRDQGWANIFPKAILHWRDDNYAFGQTGMHSWAYISGWQPGDKIRVYRGNHRTWWEGDVGPRTEAKSSIPHVSAHPAE